MRETHRGKIRGDQDNGVKVFKGIPYAATTTGLNRFRQPRPAPSWTGLRDETYRRIPGRDFKAVYGPLIEEIERWTESPDRWWRRAALVATVPLNVAAQGGTGDATRTLRVCELLVDDRDDMVVKAMSWALRRPHRKAERLASMATPFSSMARSIEAPASGIQPFWKA